MQHLLNTPKPCVPVSSSPFVPMFSLIESSFGRSVRRKTVEGASRKEYFEEEDGARRGTLAIEV